MININCIPEFEIKCPKDWEKLDQEMATLTSQEFSEHESRYCHECKKNVYKISTLEELNFAKNNNQCVALFLEDQSNKSSNFDPSSAKFKPTLGLLKNAT